MAFAPFMLRLSLVAATIFVAGCGESITFREKCGGTTVVGRSAGSTHGTPLVKYDGRLYRLTYDGGSPFGWRCEDLAM